MLVEFLAANRADLIERCRFKVARRSPSRASDPMLEHGVPLFLDQTIKTLQVERTPDPVASRIISGPSDGATPFF